MHYRLLCLQTHYRKPLNFTLENLESAKNALERLKRKVLEIKQAPIKAEDKTKEYEKQFYNSVYNDLNLPGALQVVWKMLDDLSFDSKKKISLLEEFDSVLGLSIKEIKEEKMIIPKEVSELVKKRETLRKDKKWAEADILRERIKELGYQIEDVEKEVKIIKI